MTSISTDRRQGVNAGAAVKVPVKAASTAALVLSGEQTVDGVACVTGDRVLVKDQANAVLNGIYDVDTGTWTRSVDFDGYYNVVKGTLIYVNPGGAVNGDGWFRVTTSDPITVDSTALAFSRQNINFLTAVALTAAAGQTVFNLGVNYQTGSNALQVYLNGIRVFLTRDYTESSGTTITFTYALALNDEVDVYVGTAVGQIGAAAASQSAVTDAGDYYVGTTVEAVLQEIAGAVSADNGDANAAFTNSASDRIQRWNTPLTANRTLTLNAANAKEGARCLAVRQSSATGNFTLSIGALATLRAPGEWALVAYDSATAAWVLVGYGILPSAEVLGVTSDVGNADKNLTVGTDFRTQRWATALTIERTAALQAAGAYNGARFRIERATTATGNFSLLVKTGATQLASLAPGQWADVEHTGSAWVLAAMGDLVVPNTAVVQFRDDFLGKEINGYLWETLIGTNASCLQATVLADQASGWVRLTTGADAGGTMALNGSQLQSALNFSANKGGLVWEARVKLDAITNVALFIGFTDQVAALEMPFTLGAGDALTSNASDACGVLFDTAADTDDWWLVGVKADVDAGKQDVGAAPVAATFEIWRIELSATGTATFYRNGTLVGVAMADALTASVALTPVIAAFSRAGASRNIDVDVLAMQSQR